MSRKRTAEVAWNLLRSAVRRRSARSEVLGQLGGATRGADAAATFSAPPTPDGAPPPAPELRAYFDQHHDGRGIWKWLHYFEIYERHFRKFVGKEVHIAEIGVYSGGSLDMWHHYFGPHCHVYGVDIEPACKTYEAERTRILIGDQSDRDFWRSFRQQVPRLDIVVDDGSHVPEHQIVTFEETLSHLRAGGVYLCEDILGIHNSFASYAHGFATGLNHADWSSGPPVTRRHVATKASPLQRAISSVHFYPYVTVFERTETSVLQFEAPPHGTSWQPFLGE